MSITTRARSSVLAPSFTRIASGRSLITSRSTRNAVWKSIGLEFLPSLLAILAILASFLAVMESVHSGGGACQLRPTPAQHPPPAGADIAHQWGGDLDVAVHLARLDVDLDEPLRL